MHAAAHAPAHMRLRLWQAVSALLLTAHTILIRLRTNKQLCAVSIIGIFLISQRLVLYPAPF